MASRLRIVLLHVCVLLAACNAATPQELLSQARAAIAAGELRTAEIHLKNLLQVERDNATARQLLGEVLLQSGDAAGAEQNFTIALGLGADAAAVDLPLLTALVAQLKYDEAFELIESRGLPRNAGDATQVAMLQAAAHRGQGQPERAVEVYRAALEVDPSAPNLRTELAATLLGLRRTDEARALITAVLNDQPSYSPALLLRGNLEALAGQRTAAEATFQRVVDLERADAAGSSRYLLAMAQLIEVQAGLGKIDAAAANADAFLAINPRNPLPRYAKALVEVQQNDLTSAEQRLEALIAEAPQYWPAHRLLGAINIQQDQIGQATMYLRAAVNNNPTDSAARLQLAELYVREGDLDAARQLLEGSAVGASEGVFLAFAGGASQRAGLEQQASELFDQSEQQAPSTLQQVVGLSSLYTAAGEFERAIRLLQSSSLEGEQSQQVSDYLLTLIHVRQGDLVAADAVAERLQQQLPDVAWPLNMRGVIALMRADTVAARALFAKAPESGARLRSEAELFALEGRFAEAAQVFGQLFALQPSEALALRAYDAGRRAGSPNADAQLRKWHADHPEAAATNFALGSVALEKADLAEAERRFEAVVAANPNHAASLNNLAWLYGERKDPRAVELGERALTASPDNPSIADTLGWLHVQNGDAARGLPLLAQAAAALPEERDVNYHWAVALAETGEPARAIEVLERLTADGRPFPSRAEAERRLNELRGRAR